MIRCPAGAKRAERTTNMTHYTLHIKHQTSIFTPFFCYFPLHSMHIHSHTLIKMTSSRAAQQYQASTNYKEAFSLFDKRGNGRVSLDSLGDLLRACGQNPTLAEIRDLEKSVGGDCK